MTQFPQHAAEATKWGGSSTKSVVQFGWLCGLVE
jgi:hypothetical protein